MFNWIKLPKCCKRRPAWVLVNCVYLDTTTPCFSGLSTVIYVGRYGHIRIDFMDDMEPLISFSGQDIDKMRRSIEYWFACRMIELSSSHWMYIGSELQRASVLGVSYVQG